MVGLEVEVERLVRLVRLAQQLATSMPMPVRQRQVLLGLAEVAARLLEHYRDHRQALQERCGALLERARAAEARVAEWPEVEWLRLDRAVRRG